MNVPSLFVLFRRIACRACILAGPSLLAISVGLAIYTSSFLRRSVAASGTIAGLTPMHNDQNEPSYIPVFTFTAKNGQSYTVTSNAGSDPPEFTVGQQVKVLYDPANPEGAKISSFVQLWIFPACFGLAGLIASLLGIFLLRFEQRRNLAYLFSWEGILQAR